MKIQNESKVKEKLQSLTSEKDLREFYNTVYKACKVYCKKNPNTTLKDICRMLVAWVDILLGEDKRLNQKGKRA